MSTTMSYIMKPEPRHLIDKNEAPEGFYAELKPKWVDGVSVNICTRCDARKLCQANEDEWCWKNRCMAVGVTAANDGISYKKGDVCERKDGQSVVFKLKK